MSWSLFSRLGGHTAQLGSHHPRTESASAIAGQELAEFLEGDLFPDGARPEFREQLREELWEVLQRANDARAR